MPALGRAGTSKPLWCKVTDLCQSTAGGCQRLSKRARPSPGTRYKEWVQGSWCCLPLGVLRDRTEATLCSGCRRNALTQPAAGSVAGEGGAAMGHAIQLSLWCAADSAPLYNGFRLAPHPHQPCSENRQRCCKPSWK